MYLHLRRSKGYTDELENLTKDDSKLTLTVTLKDATTKKGGLELQGTPKAKATMSFQREGQMYNIKNMEQPKTRI